MFHCIVEDIVSLFGLLGIFICIRLLWSWSGFCICSSCELIKTLLSKLTRSTKDQRED